MVMARPRKTTRRSAATSSSTHGKPETVKVFNLTFAVKFVPHEEMARAEAFGLCDFEKQLILLDESQSDESLQDTFMHEVLHAICFVLGIDVESEESLVHKLATGLCTVWNQNPAAWLWWMFLTK